MVNPEMKVDSWRLLYVFQNKVRVEILRLLLKCEMASLSEIAERLERMQGWRITLPGVLKHMKKLEEAGIVRQESGVYLEEPDARKTIYLLEGKERVGKILGQLETCVGYLLHAGVVFSKTAGLARRIQRMPRKLTGERRRLESLLMQCESKNIYAHLTEDEKKKVKLWKMMTTLLE